LSKEASIPFTLSTNGCFPFPSLFSFSRRRSRKRGNGDQEVSLDRRDVSVFLSDPFLPLHPQEVPSLFSLPPPFFQPLYREDVRGEKIRVVRGLYNADSSFLLLSLYHFTPLTNNSFPPPPPLCCLREDTAQRGSGKKGSSSYRQSPPSRFISFSFHGSPSTALKIE